MPVALLVPLDPCPNSSWFVTSAVHYCFQVCTAKSLGTLFRLYRERVHVSAVCVGHTVAQKTKHVFFSKYTWAVMRAYMYEQSILNDKHNVK